MIKILIVLLVMYKSVFSETYYEILGVSKQASTQEIKQAYKKLAVKLHPDKNTDSEDQKRFLKITEAYETLKDPQKRHKYDLYGSQNSYTKKYDYHSQSEYNNLFYNGLYHDDPHVESLSGDKFYSYLNEGLYFINFYSPFCPPCQNLADDWKKLAKVYKGIVKVGAVNCKYYNSFCFNNMRIGSYPSLLLYPNGQNGNYMYYRGGHSYDALEEYILTYLRRKVNVPSIAQIRNNDKPMVYVLADDLDENMVLRIAYHLNGLASVVMASHLRSKLAEKPETVLVFKHKQEHKEIESTDEKSIIKEIVDMLPEIEKIGLDQIKKIRNGLRRGDKTSWVLFFSKNEKDSYADRLLLHQLRIYLHEMNFGEINCNVLGSLCHSLQMEDPPGWGILKPGGAYQRIYEPARAPLRDAARATPLHTLSLTDYTDILRGDMSTWILLVAPYKVAWNHLSEPFTQACIALADTGINFGIMSCTLETDSHCRLVAKNEPVIIVQNGTNRNSYNGQAKKTEIIKFIELLKESANMELTEEQAMEIHMDTSREHTWLIAYFPASCKLCKDMLHEFRIVAKRLRPLEFLRVGILDCSRYGSKGFCSNIRISTGRLYPIASGQHFSLNLQHVKEAPYILEWILEHIDDSVLKLNWQSFTKTVIAEELNPSRNKKPWLVYFHSPRCHRCYEMYPDFAIMAIMFGTKMRFGKVNCVTERGLCQHEQITSYPSIKLYLTRNRRNSQSRVIPFQPKQYSELLNDIKPHIMGYDEEIFPEFENLNIQSQFRFRDEL